MATIYYDTDLHHYSELNWSRAVELGNVSDQLPGSKADSLVWTLILPYLDGQAINMRKVCSFFLRPEFRQIYEDSPLHLFRGDKVDFGRFFNFLPPTKNIKTNVSIYLKPSKYNDWECSFFPSECKAITHFMPKLRNLSTLLLQGDYEFMTEPNTKFPHHAVSQIVCFEDVPRWDVISRFKALQGLRCYLKTATYFLPAPNRGALASLRSFHLEGYMYNIPLNLNSVSTILKAMPNLEHFRMEVEPGRELSGGLTLEPMNLKHLQNLELAWLLGLRSVDWMHLLSAAPNIRKLKLICCSDPAEGFEALTAGELPNLEKVTIQNTLMTALGFKALFVAAPQLKKLQVDYSLETYVPFERCEFQEELYPSVRDIIILFTGRQRKAIDSFLPFVERMPGLQSLSLTKCSVSKAQIDEGISRPYANLKSFTAKDSIFEGASLAPIFNAASRIESIFFQNSNCLLLLQNLNEEALSSLSSLDLRNIKLDPITLDALLKRTPHLKILILVKVLLLLTDQQPSLTIVPGSLPELVEFVRDYDQFCLMPDQCLSIIKAAPHLQKLSLPYFFLKHFDDLPDGFLSELKVFHGNKNTCSKPGQEKQYRKLLRIAPNVQTKG